MLMNAEQYVQRWLVTWSNNNPDVPEDVRNKYGFRKKETKIFFSENHEEVVENYEINNE